MDANPYEPPRQTECLSTDVKPQSPRSASVVEIFLLVLVWLSFIKNNVGFAAIVGVVVLAVANAIKKAKWNRGVNWAFGVAVLAIIFPIDFAAMRDGNGPGLSLVPIRYVGRGIDTVNRDFVVRHINFFDYPRWCVVINLQ